MDAWSVIINAFRILGFLGSPLADIRALSLGLQGLLSSVYLVYFLPITLMLLLC
jgi:hypothetical protein